MSRTDPQRRRAKSKLGIDPVVEIDEFGHFDDLMAVVLEHFPANPPEKSTIISGQLSGFATEYHTSKKQYNKEPTRAETRAALADISAMSGLLSDHIVRGDPVAQRELVFALTTRRIDLTGEVQGQQFLDRLAKDLKNLSVAAARTDRKLADGKGKKSSPELARSVAQIVTVYEKISGKTFTHTRAEDGYPKSNCGKFVLDVMTVIDPSALGASISTELQSLKKRRNK